MVLPLDQLETFLAEAKRTGVFELYYTELSTGLRRGELLGIRWEDIDFNAGSICIQRQITRVGGEVKASPLKTKNAYRQIIVAPEVIQMLREKKEREDGFSPYVFSSPTGGPMCPDSMLHMLHRVLKRAGLEKIRFHDLRHTFSVLALQNGVDVKTLSGILGHYSAGFTLDTYGHITAAMKQDAANKGAAFWQRRCEKNREKSPCGSKCGSGKTTGPEKPCNTNRKAPKSSDSGAFLARHEGFKPPAFWSVVINKPFSIVL